MANRRLHPARPLLSAIRNSRYAIHGLYRLRHRGQTRGRCWLGYRPLDQTRNPTEGGGEPVRVRLGWGRAEARPRGFAPPAGATNAGVTPLSRYARRNGTATNFVASPDFTRIRTVRLPPSRASASALRTSSALATALPPTSRMTSPVLKPRSATGPSGSTSVTTTPLPPAPATLSAGARVRPSRGSLLPCSRSVLPTRAGWSFG